MDDACDKDQEAIEGAIDQEEVVGSINQEAIEGAMDSASRHRSGRSRRNMQAMDKRLKDRWMMHVSWIRKQSKQ